MARMAAWKLVEGWLGESRRDKVDLEMEQSGVVAANGSLLLPAAAAPIG